MHATSLSSSRTEKRIRSTSRGRAMAQKTGRNKKIGSYQSPWVDEAFNFRIFD